MTLKMIFSQADVAALGAAYETGRDETGFLSAALVTELRQLVTERFVTHQPYTVEWTTEMQFDNAAQMADYAQATGVLPINTNFNESELFGPEVNLYFRYVHDCDHIQGIVEQGGCDFSINGEACAAAKMLARTSNRTLRRIIFSEVVLQAARFYAYGDFGAQKVVWNEVTDAALARVEAAYGI